MSLLEILAPPIHVPKIGEGRIFTTDPSSMKRKKSASKREAAPQWDEYLDDIVEFIREEGASTKVEVMVAMEMSDKAARKALDWLVAKGTVIKSGSDRHPIYWMEDAPLS